ncbi:MAG: bifunctional 4-hydroxy-2-oxoglutarate aldolase/2-dehydro-3-deoxy-phosphogluconate aldolase [Angelakisella sp.]|jgi:2-dehydro-3-deoxyphosphogluconate aldolase/(4S)-4-hydroxy-2-oxoglutarate aldolase|nr:bifunctional 4-hydroxy-2-oxoglutarate aldolase/2-dehydro-3-deoxy-phosphogluconate aldolase [Angelakisella sp.]
MEDVLKRLEGYRALPLVRFDRPEDPLPLAKALDRGGLPCLAVTIRSGACLEGLEQLRQAMPEFLAGAGDIMNTGQGRRAIAAGARFLLSPVWEPSLVELGQRTGVPVIPGCATPTEIARAVGTGCSLLNFFPAGALGGIPVLEAVSGPFDQARFLVTNGVDRGNLLSYLASPKVTLCGVKWTAPVELVNSGRFDQIARLTGELAGLMGNG